MADGETPDIVEQWKQGTPFGIAWLALADRTAVREFHNAKARGSQAAYELLMIADLWARLRSGEFLALGKRMTPPISGDPAPLPTHMFEFRPPDGIANGNDIEVSGCRYEGVKVVRSSEPTTDTDIVPNASSQSAEPLTSRPNSAPQPVGSETVVVLNQIVPNQPSDGRPNTYRFSKHVLRALFDDPANVTLSAEKLLLAFTVEFQRQFPRDQYQTDAPKARTLREQITRYWQELAETGKN